MAPDLFAGPLVQAIKKLVLAAEEYVFLGGDGRAVDPPARLVGPKPLAVGRVDSDDAALVEANGGVVVVVEGERGNLKLTRPDDLELAQALLDGAHA